MRLPPWRLTIICLVVSICGQWQFGYQITYVNTAVKTFYGSFNQLYREDNNCTDCFFPESTWNTWWSIAVASFYPGAIVGFSLVPYSVKKIGVKWSLTVSALPAIVGCVVGFFSKMQAGNGPDGRQDVVLFEMIILSRILCGMHAGAALALLPLFTTECSPLRYQGFLAAFQEVAQAITDLLGFIVGSPQIITAIHHYELLQLVALAPTVLLVIVLVMIKDTPVHHFLRTKDWEKGDESLRYYHGSTVDIDIASVHIIESNQSGGQRHNSTYNLRELLWPTTREGKLVRRGLLIGTVAGASYAFTADDLIDSFSSLIFQDIQGDSPGSAKLAENVTVCLGAVLVISAIFGCFTVEKIGRRRVLIGGLFGTALSNGLIPFCQFLPTPNLATAMSIVLFVLCKVFIGLGAGAPAWFLTSELVPPAARSIAQSISTGILLITSGVVTAVFLQLQNLIGQFSLMVLAGVPAAICAFILWLFLPETKHKLFADIRNELSDRKLIRKSSSEESLLMSHRGEDTGYGSAFDSSAWSSLSDNEVVI